MKLLSTLGLFICFFQWADAQMVIQATATNVSCFGGNNGSAQAMASGGTSPYSYLWNTGEHTNSVSSLATGTYTVTATDNVGNTASKTLTITEPPLLGATLNGQPQICTIAPDGFSYAIPTGGTPPCTFSWSNGTQTQLNNHLTANSYTVTVTDTRGCTVVKSYTVGFLGLGLYLFTDAAAATCPQPNNGAASVEALSGNGPYQYHWSNGASTADIDHLEAGNYEVTVSDVNGCSASTTVLVTREDVDTTSIQVLVPQCTGEPYGFESTGEYHVYDWTLNDSRDSILSGAGTSQIQVIWGASGEKVLTVGMSDTTNQCATGMQFKVTVFVCEVATADFDQEHLRVAPNPFGPFISISGEVDALNGSEVSLWNAQGQMLTHQKINDRSSTIQTEWLVPGLYYLKWSTGSDQRVWKVIKVYKS